MVITEEKIRVTELMMFNEGLSRTLITGEIGIPQYIAMKREIKWKHIKDLSEDDFNQIELYFLYKKNQYTNQPIKSNFCESCGGRNCIC